MNRNSVDSRGPMMCTFSFPYSHGAEEGLMLYLFDVSADYQGFEFACNRSNASVRQRVDRNKMMV